MNHQSKRRLEELNALIVLAGGKSFTIDELSDMRLGEVLEFCLPNGITLIPTALRSYPAFSIKDDRFDLY